MPTVTQLINYMNANGYVGSRNYITAGEMADHFGISDGGVNVEMRNVIRDAIAHGHLIGSHGRGFYIINSLAQLERNLDSLESRAANILQRRRNMINAWNAVNPPVGRVDLFVRP